MCISVDCFGDRFEHTSSSPPARAPRDPQDLGRLPAGQILCAGIVQSGRHLSSTLAKPGPRVWSLDFGFLPTALQTSDVLTKLSSLTLRGQGLGAYVWNLRWYPYCMTNSDKYWPSIDQDWQNIKTDLFFKKGMSKKKKSACGSERLASMGWGYQCWLNIDKY